MLFLSLFLGYQTVASEPVLDLLRKVDTAQRKIKSVAVVVKAKNTTERFTRYGRSKTTGEFVERWCIGEKGSGWAKCRGELSQVNPDGTVDSGTQTQVSVFDGSVGKSVVESEWSGQKNSVAYILPELKGRLGSPMKFLVPFDATNLKPGDWDLDDSKTWDGSDAVVLSRVKLGVDNQQGDFRTEYWLLPERGYAIVRHRQFRRPNGEKDWTELLSISCSGHVKHKFGIWVPAHGESRLTTNASEVTTEYTFSDWSLEQEPEAKDLQLAFPEGIRVIDRMPKASSP